MRQIPGHDSRNDFIVTGKVGINRWRIAGLEGNPKNNYKLSVTNKVQNNSNKK
jgi:hypothetical protein